VSRLTIPLFPLHTVLFPGGVLPLRIFEPRYLDMVSECMRHNSGFGVCLIREGKEVGAAAQTYDVGTLVRISYFDRRHDGRHQRLLLVKRDGNRLLALRLWASDVLLLPGRQPLWLGSASYLESRRVLGTLTIPHTQGDFTTPLTRLRNDLQTSGWTQQLRRRTDGSEVLLLREQGD